MRGPDPDVELSLARRLAGGSARTRRGASRSAARARSRPAPRPHERQHGLFDVGFARQILGRRHGGHAAAMLEPVLLQMVGGRHGEDRVAVLDRDHAPGGEAPAVADAVDLVDDRDRRVAGPSGNRRAANAARGRPRRAGGRDQRLTDHLPPNTRCQPVWALRPRKRLCSSGSRSRIFEQVVDGGGHAWPERRGRSGRRRPRRHAARRRVKHDRPGRRPDRRRRPRGLALALARSTMRAAVAFRSRWSIRPGRRCRRTRARPRSPPVRGACSKPSTRARRGARSRSPT